jgi:hypothetical protein
MDQNPPKNADKDAQAFAFAVGRTVQNYGTIEYLINELIAFIINDRLISSHMVKQPVSKRIEILEALVKRDALAIERDGLVLASLFSAAKSAFINRNKVAHNPFVIREQKIEGKSHLTSGIHVIRYSENGNSEEWIDLPKLEAFTLASRELLIRFNQLLGHYVAK